MKIFGFDLDGVLYNWHKVVHDYMVRYRDEKESLTDFWKAIVNGDREYSDIFWYNMVRIEPFYYSLTPKKDDVYAVNEIAKVYDVYYITHRPKEVEYVTKKWLRNWGFPSIENLVLSTYSKDIIVRSVGCSYYVEDRPEILKSNLRYVTNLIAKRNFWNEEACKDLPYIDEIIELLDYI